MSQVMKKIRKSINEKAGKSVAKILTVQGNCEGSLLFYGLVGIRQNLKTGRLQKCCRM